MISGFCAFLRPNCSKVSGLALLTASLLARPGLVPGSAGDAASEAYPPAAEALAAPKFLELATFYGAVTDILSKSVNYYSLPS